MFSFQGASLCFRTNLQFLIASLEKCISCSTLIIAVPWSDSTIDWVDYKARFARLVIAQWNLGCYRNFNQRLLKKEVVGQNGLEPSTSRLSVVCSSQLSYWPISSKSNPQLTHLMQALNARLWLCFSSPQQTRFAGLCRGPHFLGGEYRDRTGDLLLARQALSQLS